MVIQFNCDTVLIWQTNFVTFYQNEIPNIYFKFTVMIFKTKAYINVLNCSLMIFFKSFAKPGCTEIYKSSTFSMDKKDLSCFITK